MRLVLAFLLSVLLCSTAAAGSGRVIKVLPHLLDLNGHHALSPSLYERDAYQAYLREHPEKQSGIRFDIQWKASRTPPASLKLKAEVRGVLRGDSPELIVIQKEVERKWLSRWNSLMIEGSQFQQIGQVTAWRVTLWENDTLLSEQKSFLW